MSFVFSNHSFCWGIGKIEKEKIEWKAFSAVSRRSFFKKIHIVLVHLSFASTDMRNILDTNVYIYAYMWGVCMCVWTDNLCLPILSLTNSSLCTSPLTFGWNEFRKDPYSFQVLSTPTGDFFWGENYQKTMIWTSHIHLY